MEGVFFDVKLPLWLNKHGDGFSLKCLTLDEYKGILSYTYRNMLIQVYF